jgi:hypothetical protein
MPEVTTDYIAAGELDVGRTGEKFVEQGLFLPQHLPLTIFGVDCDRFVSGD